MTVDEVIRMIEACAKLADVLVWPAIVAYFLIRFGPYLKDFFSSAAEFSFKGAGFEATAKRKQTEIAASLVAARAAKPENSTEPASVAREARAIANLVAGSVTPRAIRRADRSQILWVDDRPNNNINERQAMEALGISFTLSTSTDDALARLKNQQYDIIISDMGRPQDPQAGYTLLDSLRAIGDQTPFIIYAGSQAPEHRSEARSRGAISCTNQPDELFELVLMALQLKN